MQSKNSYYYILPEEIEVTGIVNNLVINSNYVHLLPTAPGVEITGFNSEVTEDHAANFISENNGVVNLTLKNISGSSSAGNQLYLGGSDVILAPGQYAFFIKCGLGYILRGTT